MKNELQPKKIMVVLAGNPNSGKTTLFNQLTGANQKVGNYPGVTVERKEGQYIHNGVTFYIVDLPGVYSMTAYSPEEQITRDFLITEKPDVVVNVLDASNLERNLSFTVQMMELGLNLVLALNMADELQKSGRKINLEKFSEKIRLPLIATVGHRGDGLENLREAIFTTSQEKKEIFPLKVSYHTEVEEGVEQLIQLLPNDLAYPKRYVALQLLEGDPEILQRMSKIPISSNIMPILKDITEHIQTVCGDLPDVVISDGRYGLAKGLVRDATIQYPGIDRVSLSEKIDSVITHRVFALPIFLGLMYALFWFVFTLGEWPMIGLEWVFQKCSLWVIANLNDGFWKSMLVEGIIAGVGGVIIFLPNILLLFMGIAFLEDSGYMARAAFIMDGFMNKIGLQGKSFIPMLIGFGCSVPGIMATRILENEKDRLATMFILPLMSCGARFTIYALIIPIFFPRQYQALILWMIYILGILIAAGLAKLIRITILSGPATPFVMELPPYRLPTWKGIIHHMWQRSTSYLQKAATVILLISIVIWLASYYPQKPISTSLDNTEITAEQISLKIAQEQLEYSVLGRVGKAIEPIVAPMGFDWRLATAMVGAFTAKEIFVAQLSIIFSASQTNENTTLREKLHNSYTPLVAICILVFCLISTPCVATVSIMYKESGGWKWPMLQFWGFTGLAYVICVTIYQVGTRLGF